MRGIVFLPAEVSMAMNTQGARFVAVAALTFLSPLAAAQFRPVADQDGWCRDDRSSRPSACEVREVVLSSHGTLHVDAGPNGGVHAQGWERGETRVRAK